MNRYDEHIDVLMPARFHQGDETWIRGMLLGLGPTTRGRIAYRYSEVYEEVYDAEPVSWRKDNRGRRAANTRLREFVTTYVAASQGYVTTPPLLQGCICQGNSPTGARFGTCAPEVSGPVHEPEHTDYAGVEAGLGVTAGGQGSFSGKCNNSMVGEIHLMVRSLARTMVGEIHGRSGYWHYPCKNNAMFMMSDEKATSKGVRLRLNPGSKHPKAITAPATFEPAF